MSTWYNAKCYDIIYVYCVCAANYQTESHVDIHDHLHPSFMQKDHQTAEHLPGHCCVKPMLISPIPKKKILPPQKMNRSKRFQGSYGAITAIYHIYRGFYGAI